ncbi:MAG: DUF2817 domain-containing protein [Bdellovibrionales bacterium]|nr:DUF2817 domain-containing protein [Bdellovibrionales bacterium]
MKQSFEEFEMLEKIVARLEPYADIEIVANSVKKNASFPLYVIRMGSKRKSAPTIGFFGGVHGLERIGTKVLLSYLGAIAELMPWDKMLHSILRHMQFVFMPLVNPIGMLEQKRSNQNDVDIMRNAPIDSDIVRWYHIWGGHRVSKYLPWYRGRKGAPMEVESQALCDVVQKYLFPSTTSISLDIHSGFGSQDQLWFPYAYTREPFKFIAQAYQLKSMLDKAYPFHVYRFEPQSVRYQTHGDLWDYLSLEQEKEYPRHFFMPMTLELGSWAWLKKSPKHIFSLMGMFNPMKEHRKHRTFRRHLVLFDFLTRAVVSHQKWVDLPSHKVSDVREKAISYWNLQP